jgi:hypothetical protein
MLDVLFEARHSSLRSAANRSATGALSPTPQQQKPRLQRVVPTSSILLQHSLFDPIHKLNGLVISHEFFETADDIGFHRMKAFFAVKIRSNGLIEAVVQVGTDFLNFFGTA